MLEFENTSTPGTPKPEVAETTVTLHFKCLAPMNTFSLDVERISTIRWIREQVVRRFDNDQDACVLILKGKKMSDQDLLSKFLRPENVDPNGVYKVFVAFSKQSPKTNTDVHIELNDLRSNSIQMGEERKNPDVKSSPSFEFRMPLWMPDFRNPHVILKGLRLIMIIGAVLGLLFGGMALIDEGDYYKNAEKAQSSFGPVSVKFNGDDDSDDSYTWTLVCVSDECLDVQGKYAVSCSGGKGSCWREFFPMTSSYTGTAEEYSTSNLPINGQTLELWYLVPLKNNDYLYAKKSYLTAVAYVYYGFGYVLLAMGVCAILAVFYFLGHYLN